MLTQTKYNYAKGRHYAVLGFKIVCSMFGEIKVFGLPYLKLCSMNTSQIKSAYRQSPKLVHADKNRDGHAAEAFDALEKSASLLLDPVKKMDWNFGSTLLSSLNWIVDSSGLVVGLGKESFFNFPLLRLLSASTAAVDGMT